MPVKPLYSPADDPDVPKEEPGFLSKAGDIAGKSILTLLLAKGRLSPASADYISSMWGGGAQGANPKGITEASELQARGDYAGARAALGKFLRQPQTDKSMTAHALKTLQGLSELESQATGAQEISDLISENGPEKAREMGLMAYRAFLGSSIYQKALARNHSPAEARALAEMVLGNAKIEQVGTDYVASSNGQVISREPIPSVHKIGEALIKLEGTRVVSKLAEQPGMMVIPAEHGGVVEKPGVQIMPEAAPVGGKTATGMPVAGGYSQAPMNPMATPREIMPPRASRIKLSEKDAKILAIHGIKAVYMDEIAEDPEKQRLLADAQDPEKQVMPTAEQAGYLSKMGVPIMSWNQLHSKYPGIGAKLIQLEEDRKVQESVRRMTEQKHAMSTIPWAVSGANSAKAMFDVAGRFENPALSLQDTMPNAKGERRGALLDPVSARSVRELQKYGPMLAEMRQLTQRLASENPGGNLVDAVKAAAARGVASSEALAKLDALTGIASLDLARALNGGRPTEPDAEKVANTITKIGRDTVRTGLARLSVLENLINASVDGYLGKPVAPMTHADLDKLDGKQAAPKVQGAQGVAPGGGDWDDPPIRKPGQASPRRK